MTIIPSTRQVAHDLLDIADRVEPLRDALQHPDSVEHEIHELKRDRLDLLAAIDLYVARVTIKFNRLLVNEGDAVSVLEEHYRMAEGED